MTEETRREETDREWRRRRAAERDADDAREGVGASAADDEFARTRREERAEAYDRREWIETAKGNRIHRTCGLFGARRVMLSGKTVFERGAVVRGDTGRGIRMGRYGFLGKHSVMRCPGPSPDRRAPVLATYGAHVYVGERCVCRASRVGSYVRIGNDVILGDRSVLHDCCVVRDGAVIAPDTVVPPFTVVAGVPARNVRELPLCTPEIAETFSREIYRSYRAVQDAVA